MCLDLFVLQTIHGRHTMPVTQVTSGHANDRRTIWDLVQNKDAGGGQTLHQLSCFTPVHAGAQIGGARQGFGHYHKNMWETYLILSGHCVMSLMDVATKEVSHHVIDAKYGEAPWKIEIPPQVAHRLTANSPTTLLIAATGPQAPEDTFEIELEEFFTINQKKNSS